MLENWKKNSKLNSKYAEEKRTIKIRAKINATETIYTRKNK